MSASKLMRITIMLALAGFGLAGCTGDMDDLDRYINEIKARPGGRIEPLPRDYALRDICLCRRSGRTSLTLCTGFTAGRSRRSRRRHSARSGPKP